MILDYVYVYAISGYTQLAKFIHVDNEREVAITKIHTENSNINPRYFAIVANVVDISLVNDIILPILRCTHSLKGEFAQLYYESTSVIRVSYIDMKLFINLNI